MRKEFRKPVIKKVEAVGFYRCKVCGSKVGFGEFVLVDEFPICNSCLNEVRQNPLGVLVEVIRRYETELEELEFEKDLI